MLLESLEPTLVLSTNVKYDNRLHMAYASTGSLQCFECGDVGYKRHACPHREQADGLAPATPGSTDAGRGGPTVAG
jgi:hypothetical protein